MTGRHARRYSLKRELRVGGASAMPMHRAHVKTVKEPFISLPPLTSVDL